jgi:hypothetical protein
MAAQIGKTFLPLALVLLASGCGGSSAPAQSPESPAAEKAAPSSVESQDATKAPAAGAGATAPGYPSSAARPEEESARSTDIETWSKQLEGALALSAPDCTTAWALRDRICDLAQRLCDVAGRSAEPEVAERCTDGRSRCERATSRVRASCAD